MRYKVLGEIYLAWDAIFSHVTVFIEIQIEKYLRWSSKIACFVLQTLYNYEPSSVC